MLLQACSKGFLEKEPVGRISKEVLFTDVDGARAAIYGAYTKVADYYADGLIVYGDMAADHVKDTPMGQTPRMYNEYIYNSSVADDAGAPGQIWTSIYEALNNVNNVLEAMPDLQSKFPESKKELDQITGQALILRAFCHFDVCKVYGQHYQYTADAGHLGVPVILQTPAPRAQVSRNSVKEVYSQVITDLKSGEKLLKENPMTRDQALVSYQAAWGMLSRVYLYMGEWDQSIAYADSVLNKGGYLLSSRDSYLNMYLSGSPSSEVIWQLYKRSRTLPATAKLFSYEVSANTKLLSLFGTGDIRRSVFRDTAVTSSSRLRTITLKYGATKEPAVPAVADPKVLRLSEIYLNRAEAQWNKKNYTQAAADVLVIAQRANGSTPVTVPTDPALLYTFICDERSRELCFEGHRLFDLARRKQDVIRGADCEAPVCTLTYPNVRFVLPITQKELDANKAMQPNPGIN